MSIHKDESCICNFWDTAKRNLTAQTWECVDCGGTVGTWEPCEPYVAAPEGHTVFGIPVKELPCPKCNAMGFISHN